MDSNLIDDLLECSVCLKPLDEQNKVLPCQHTFCKSCLLGIVQSQKELRCPECRIVVKQRVDELPSNILLIRLLDGIKFQHNQLKQHSEKHARRLHSVEGILNESPPASGETKDGGTGNKQANVTTESQKNSMTDGQPQTTRTLTTDSVKPYAQALYTYHSDQPSDLPFVKGDKVYLLKKIDENWMSGECRGQTGVFPINYVKVIQPLLAERPICTALYDFEPSDESQDRDCLTFSKNDKILAIRRVDENWIEGMFKEKIGIFPLAFVKANDEAKKLLDIKAPLAKDESTSTRPEIQKVTSGPAARRIVNNKQGTRYAKKRHSFPTFHAVKKEEEPTTSYRHSMEILDSDTNRIVSRSDMAATQPSTNQPFSSANQGKQENSTSLTRQRHPVVFAASPDSSSLPSNHIRLRFASTASAERKDSEKTNGNTSRSKSADRPRATITSDKLSVLAIVKATFTYHAVKPDELDLIKGDTYQIIEVCNDGWCRGRHLKTGKVGVFPGNYVALSLSITRSSPVMPKDDSTAPHSSSNSSSSSSSPLQSQRSNRSSEHSKTNQAHRLPHVSSSSSSSSRTPPPRPNAPPARADPSSSGKARSESPSSSTDPAQKLRLRIRVKDKKKDKGQLFLKMITGSSGTSSSSSSSKKLKSPMTPASPPPRLLTAKASGPESSSSSQTKPSLKPLMRDKYRAIMNYPANSADELDLREGDIVVVHHRRSDGWFRGTHLKNGRSGHFPSTFVERCQEE